jgi:hypothetical protein
VTGGRTESEGGGILVEEGGLSLHGVALVDNEAFNSGYGGGIYSEESELEIVDSTIAGNRNSGDGGGICAYDSEITIENSTIADNTTDTSLYPTSPGWGAYGGGLEIYGGPLLTLINVTISGNKVIDGNGGEEGNGAAISGGEFDAYEIANTIIYGNIAEEVEELGQCTERPDRRPAARLPGRQRRRNRHRGSGEHESGNPRRRCDLLPSDGSARCLPYRWLRHRGLPVGTSGSGS